ncbi:uncharacterized protein LOC117649955 [Thrips palmi]|uniref:Uncharacterized protein LOC117649955 n=1 Tax=Thrips palmi TaxID=161013 RepID=A0A6P8ZVE6_THRPL|nr:uncharacterized protein LOC117649955 [Thrips palmi]
METGYRIGGTDVPDSQNSPGNPICILDSSIKSCEVVVTDLSLGISQPKDVDGICMNLQDNEVLPAADSNVTVLSPGLTKSPCRILLHSGLTSSPHCSASSKEPDESSLDQDCAHDVSAVDSSPVESHLCIEKPASSGSAVDHLQGTLSFDPDDILKNCQISKQDKNAASENSTVSASPTSKTNEERKMRKDSCAEIVDSVSNKDQPSGKVSASFENDSDQTKLKHVKNCQELPPAVGEAESFLTNLGSLIRESMVVVDELENTNDISETSTLKWNATCSVEPYVNLNAFSQDPCEDPFEMPQKPGMVNWGNRNSYQYEKTKCKNDINNNCSSLVYSKSTHSEKNEIAHTVSTNNRKLPTKGAILRQPSHSKMVHKIRKPGVSQHALALRHMNGFKLEGHRILEAPPSPGDKIGIELAVNPVGSGSERTSKSSKLDGAVPQLFTAFTSFIQSARSLPTPTQSATAATLTTEAWKRVLAQAQRK